MFVQKLICNKKGIYYIKLKEINSNFILKYNNN